MEIKPSSITFASFSGSGPREDAKDFTFDRDITKAVAILTGFKAGFVKSGGDHNLGNLTIQLDTDIAGRTVTVSAIFGLHDWSGEWDDKYGGTVYFAIVAE
jgi:hypothetical protein